MLKSVAGLKLAAPPPTIRNTVRTPGLRPSGEPAYAARHNRCSHPRENHRDPSPVQASGAKLQLNGAGVRYKAIFKVYAAGPYLGIKAVTPEAALAAPGPKLLQLVMLREIDGNELGKLFTRGMEQNAAREDFSNSTPGIMRMSDVFPTRKKLAARESFALEWVPGSGTVIIVNGNPASEPITVPEVCALRMKVRLGNSPADAALKKCSARQGGERARRHQLQPSRWRPDARPAINVPSSSSRSTTPSASTAATGSPWL